MSEPQTEIEISKESVKLVGVYEDFRPAVQTVVSTVNHVLKVADNVVGLPADYINHHLTRFRDRYRARVEATPIEHRKLPPFRVAYLVLREVVAAATEPDLQEMFAKLLASASDARTAANVHPSFAETLNNLNPCDAAALRYTGGCMGDAEIQSWHESTTYADRAASTDNLLRLGLVEPSYSSSLGYSRTAENFGDSFKSVAIRHTGRREQPTQVDYGKGLTAAAKVLVKDFDKKIEDATKPIGNSLTKRGELFLKACIPDIESAGD
jgi:hypothetical protein